MKISIIIPLVLSCCSFTACSQNTATKQDKPGTETLHVGGRCEGCEAIYECPLPFEQLNETDTYPTLTIPGPK